MTDQPNILFIMSDQHAPRVTGCYGDEIIHTPNLDKLAAKGTTFDNAYTPSPLCVPARMSFLTGKYPSSQNCWTNSDSLASDLPTTAHSLGAAGYKPKLVGRLHSIGPDQMHGYEERIVGDHSTNWIGGFAHTMGVLTKTNGPFRVSLEASGGGQSSYELHDRDVTQAALEQLDKIAEDRKNGDITPFSLNVGYLLPHQPYVADPELVDYYLARISAPKHSKTKAENEHPSWQWWRKCTGIDVDIPQEQIDRSRAAYYALTEIFDGMVGEVLDRLDENGLAENTIIIYTSDHGDQLGERGLWWKQTFYDDSVKIPLIFSMPGVVPEGERRSQVVNLIDLSQTLLQAVGAPQLPGADGRSFWDVILNSKSSWQNETFSEYCIDGMAPWASGITSQQRMIRSGKWKLIYYSGHRPQLFNLELDPDEINDLADDTGHVKIIKVLTSRIFENWDPNSIEKIMADRRKNKELLSQWSRFIKPPENHLWELKMEDNWLSEKP